jgi:hypothetical protein
LFVPTALLGTSFAGQVFDTYGQLEKHELQVQAPAATVAQWPLVGERIFQI